MAKTQQPKKENLSGESSNPGARNNSRKNFFSSILSFWAKYQIAIALFFLVFAILFPIIFDKQYFIAVGITVLMYASLSVSLNLITGYMGITSLGHAAFMGIGAYTAALLSTKLGANFLITFSSAAVVAGMFGVILGLPSLRIKGRYLAIVTLGFSEIARLLELNWMSLTRGPQGIAAIPKMGLFGVVFKTPIAKYYVILALLVVVILIVSAIINSRIGRAIRAIRDDETAAAAMGIDVFKKKILIFAISSALAGASGAYFAHYMSFIDPNAFNITQAFLILSMTIFGGLASIPGSIFGALVLIVLPEALRFLIDYRQVIYGLIIIIMMVYQPSGLFGSFNLKHIQQQDQFNKTHTRER